MEKRSRRRIRDLVALAASQGLSQNEIGCARISMMARSTNAPCRGRIQMRKTNHLQIITFGLQRTAGRSKLRVIRSPRRACRAHGTRKPFTDSTRLGIRSWHRALESRLQPTVAPRRWQLRSMWSPVAESHFARRASIARTRRKKNDHRCCIRSFQAHSIHRASNQRFRASSGRKIGGISSVFAYRDQSRRSTGV